MPKQLSLSERIIIERMISKDYSFASIGRNLERSASTISREVIKYRCFVDRIPLPGENDCTHKNSCLKNSICDDVGVHGCYGYRCKRCPEDRICTNICASYESSQCPLLDKPPYVCTNCSMLKQCKRNKAYYTAHRADAAHHKCPAERCGRGADGVCLSAAFCPMVGYHGGLVRAGAIPRGDLFLPVSAECDCFPLRGKPLAQRF